jgi:hypothetical protein
MDQSSQVKVINAGFIIIRKDDTPSPRIKVKNKEHHEWVTLTKYDSKASRDRAFDAALEIDNYIND